MNIIKILLFSSWILLFCHNPSALQDVYAAGHVNCRAVYWENGEHIALTDGSYRSKAYAIALSQDVVYCAGWVEFDNENLGAALWKNGVETRLSDGSSPADATSLWISGDDVYVAGHLDWNIAYWKNGELFYQKKTRYQSLATSVSVLGDDLYLTTMEYVIGENNLALLLKNGRPLAKIFGITDARITDVLVSGDDIYLAGSKQGLIPEWYAFCLKNNDMQFLSGSNLFLVPIIGYNPYQYPLPLKSAIASSIWINGNDVYLAGHVYYHKKSQAAFWKNGREMHLTDGKHHASANSLAVSGRKVYIAGSEENETGRDVAIIWVNKRKYELTDGGTDAEALSIALKEAGNDK